MKRIILVLLLIMVSYSISITSWSTDKPSYEPGDSGYITLNINLIPTLKQGETFVRYQSVNIKSYSALLNIDTTLGNMDKNTITVSIPFNVGDIHDGIYGINIQVSGLMELNDGTTKFDTSKTIIPVKIVREPVFKITLDSYNLHKKGSLTLNLCSLKGRAKSITITSSLNFDSGLIYIDEINASQCVEKTITYNAEMLNEGDQNIVFTINYKNNVGDKEKTTITIPVTLSKDDSRFSIKQENYILHKQNSVLKLDIENLGNNAENVRIYAPGEISFLTGTEYNIGELPSHVKKTFEIPVYSTLNPGITKETFIIKWKEDGKDKEENIVIPINVHSKDSISVYLEANPLPLTINKKATLSVVTANKASYSMSAVSVSIDSDGLQILEVDNKKFIGSLDDDDFSSQQFSILPTKTGKINVTVTVHYKDPSGKELTKKFIKEINVYDQKEESNMLPYIVVLIVVIIGIYVWWRKK